MRKDRTQRPRNNIGKKWEKTIEKTTLLRV
jgi:hypothetical protein